MNTSANMLFVCMLCILVLIAKYECDRDKKEFATVYSHCEGNKECIVNYYESMEKPTE